MSVTIEDLRGLDYVADGMPFYRGSLSDSLHPNTLDMTYAGLPYSGVEGVPAGPNDTTLIGELSVSVAFAGALQTGIALAGQIDSETSLTGYLNLGGANKLEIVF